MTLPNIPKRIRDKIYPEVIQLDGEYCQGCKKNIHELNVKSLELRRIRNEYPLDNPQNYILMCHSCNHKKEFSSVVKETDEGITASHRANIAKHPIFLQWLSNEMSENNYHMPKDEIINSGAYVSGANIVTVSRWLKPLISKEGIFSEADVMGIPTVFLKGRESRLEMPDNNEDLR